ncbi:DEAD/DEAH box helicase [Marinobacterium sedimentorum]|uniref:DEAD/DEAH box helicase n=1 Tax=Marinobacterium sedimentorum TaxID=2927804 RepID=UPI0020C619BD|nr:ATP-binding protein [Marinobacterium sedimentorum]MCP8687138.1 AAA domain-containing protein [Marinobacterium sedimentorum]
MKLNELSLLSSEIVILNCPEGNREFQDKDEIQFFLESDHWYGRQGDVVKPVVITNGSAFFEGLAGRRETIWILSKKTEKQLHLRFISTSERLPITLDIGVDALVVEFLYKETEILEKDMGQACQWLTHEFVVEGAISKLIVSRFQGSGEKDFQVIGRKWRADIQPAKDGGYLLRRIARKTQRPSSVNVLEGIYTFIDASAATRLQDPAQKAMLEATLQSNTAYLELWKLYNDLSWKRAQGSASRLGALPYDGFNTFEIPGGNAWRLIPKSMESFHKFKELWKQLEIPDSTQVEVSEQEPDWTADLIGADSQEKMVRGVIAFDQGSLTVWPDTRRRNSKPPDKGYIYYSLAGDRTAGKRREEAKRAIDSGKRLPQLRYLLEGVSVPIDRHRKLKDLTRYAEETFKGGIPTDRQRRALSVALNTPDIALIIGPPGTGKTQVIAALQRRLAEENGGRNLRGQVLVSSYQHDAVDNALSRSDVFGLPPVRVGGRQPDGQVSGQFEHWSSKLASHLDGCVKDLELREPLLGYIKALRKQFQLLRMARLDIAGRIDALQNAEELLSQVQASGSPIPASLEARWQEYLENQLEVSHKTRSEYDRKPLLLRVRGLRIEPKGFADDGADRAYDLQRWLRREGIELKPNHQSLLQQAADAQLLDDLQLAELGLLRDQLMDRILPDYRPPEIRSRLDSDGLVLIADLEKALEKGITASRKGIAGVLEQLSNALHFDPLAAQSTTQEYAMVVGATCQQAAGAQMSNLKEVAGLEHSSISFDTVVVDEAARANPLDLFVPMAMAERRIVLVGDDRQLPHLLEPEIEQEVAAQHDLTTVERKAFETSLFERLRIQLQRLEREDGVQRVVMLNTQFRMHPVLGDFVSKNFYESVGMETVLSGRGAEDFVHQLPGYEGKVCAWLDVPGDLGYERKFGTSRIRQVEAERVAQEVARLLAASNEDVSVGVITFYSAQSSRIMEQLERIGVMQKTPEGYQPVDEYRLTSDGEERLRVGSVDAFQGKEFDVVLLSNVRSSNRKISASTDNPEQREAQLNGKYGFLRLANRMNVAMSRQRKLLVIVGDRAMAEGEEAQEAVPALVAFADLCRGSYGCIR